MSVQSQLSSEEFKGRIYQSLQGKGILDSLKSQMRHKLARELHVMMGIPAQGSPPAKSVERKCLRAQVVNSIIAQYLQRKGYEYSLSTFLPEAGLNLADMVSEEDMMHYLRVSPSSEAYTKMQTQTQQQDGTSFLESLLMVVVEGLGNGGCRCATSEASVQVCAGEDVEDNKAVFKTSIGGKLKQLEEKYAQKSEEESARYKASLDDRLEAVQKELESHYKKQLQTEMELFQMRELAKMRQEEKEKYRAELAKEREEMQTVYNLRMESVKKSEKNSVEMYRRKEKDLEASIFSQRQVLLGELNSLKVKEAELKRQADLDKKSIELERERIKAMSEQMERSLQQMNVQFDLIAKTKAINLGSLVQSPRACPRDHHHHHDSTLELSLCQDKIKRLEDALSEEKRTMDGVQGQLTEELSRSDSLRRQLQDSNLKNASLLKANNEAELKLSQCADYLQVKSESSRLRQQLTNSTATVVELEASKKKQRLTIEQLQAQLSQTLPDMTTVQKELAQLHEAHRRQVLVLEYDKKHACKKLQAQMEHNCWLKNRLDEQLIQLKSAQREVEDLHFLLEHKSGHRKVREDSSGLRDRKRMDTRCNTSSQRTPRAGKSSLRRRTPKFILPLDYASSPDMSGVHDVSNTPTPSAKTVNFFDSQLPFLAESKAAMHRIEKEADELERTYQEYQQSRAGSSATQHRHSNPTHDLHLRTNRELFQSSPKQSLVQGRITPMDYLKTDSCTFNEPPPLHSTAHHSLFSTEDLPVENKLKSSLHATDPHTHISSPPLVHFSSHNHQQQTTDRVYPPNDHTHSTFTTEPLTSKYLRPLFATATESHLPINLPTQSFPSIPTTANTNTATSTAAPISAVASTTSTVVSTVPASPPNTVISSEIITIPSAAHPTSPLVFSQQDLITENTRGENSLRGFSSLNGDSTIQAPPTFTCTTMTTTPSSPPIAPVTVTTTCADPITARESPSAAVAGATTGGSGSLQSWWKNSELDSSNSTPAPPITAAAFSKPSFSTTTAGHIPSIGAVGFSESALPTTVTGFSKAAPPTAAAGPMTSSTAIGFNKAPPPTATAEFSKAVPPPTGGESTQPSQSVTATAPHTSLSPPNEIAETTPTPGPPQTSFLDSFWKSSKQEVKVHAKSSSPVTHSETNSRDHKVEESSSESVEESISITDDSHDHSKMRPSVKETSVKQPSKEKEEDTIDPVMLKYMKLVEEKKKSSSPALASSIKIQEEADDNEIRSQSSSFGGGGGPSEQDDPFEDW